MWKAANNAPGFAGLKFAIYRRPGYDDIALLHPDSEAVLSDDPGALAIGAGNSGYQAIDLGFHLGGRRALLVGYDMRAGPGGRLHWHENHPIGMNNPDDTLFRRWREAMAALPPVLAARGLEIVNCTPNSAVTCFPAMPIEEALACSG